MKSPLPDNRAHRDGFARACFGPVRAEQPPAGRGPGDEERVLELTARERDVLVLVARGLADDEIAAERFVTSRP
jgi:DNA-binding NarL/FixJ family response regulator